MVRSLPRLIAACVLTAAIAASPSLAQETISRELATALRPVEDLSRTGVLYDRVLPLAHLERLDGTPGAPIVSLAMWRQGLDELSRAALSPAVAPDRAVIDGSARAAIHSGVI